MVSWIPEYSSQKCHDLKMQRELKLSVKGVHPSCFILRNIEFLHQSSCTMRPHDVIHLNCWSNTGSRCMCVVKYHSVLSPRRVYFTSQSDPFCDFKEGFQEEAADRGWTFTFTFHRSRVHATAERRLPRASFEVRPQSRQCLYSSSTSLTSAWSV